MLHLISSPYWRQGNTLLLSFLRLVGATFVKEFIEKATHIVWLFPGILLSSGHLLIVSAPLLSKVMGRKTYFKRLTCSVPHTLAAVELVKELGA